MAARTGKTELTDSWKTKIKASMIMNRLIDHYLGKLEVPLDVTQIKAAEVVLARLVPTLSAVEQTVIDDRDRATEPELQAKLVAMLTANPALLAQINALVGNAAVLQASVPAPAIELGSDRPSTLQ